ncbi:MAG: CPBP family intramembrane glutamic endopeptidase [Candidatus Thorarchaeota archaeon]
MIEKMSNEKSAILFFVLVLTIGFLGYTPMVLSSYGLMPGYLAGASVLIGGMSPTLAAVITFYVRDGKKGPKILLEGFKRRFSAVWLLVALALPLVVFYGAWTLSKTVLGGPEVAGIDLLMVSVFLLQMFAMNVWEEIGWRGCAQPILQAKYAPLVSSLLIGAVWSVWHIPLFVVNNSQMLDVYGSFLVFVPFVMADAVVYGWLYNSTNGNLVVATLYHAMTNAIGGALLYAGIVVPAQMLLLIISIVAAVAVAADRHTMVSGDDAVAIE